ncbi:metallophosphoesterase [Paenibacillus methanolicus]|uniref:Serine/threonine protein phosphatase 1 n=1 Tax=Paenibacillus methanolicus TaxID=582686 RepID=A0A5S5CG30_9BACL|nr:metallophosphoesterase [Paenibacillus methanolicus]TYP78109.1 serine/threonine protein phosphatase 1 [Paenibacillus methanolicus]
MSGSRLFAISDIHGHVEGLRLLLKQAGYRPGQDALVLLGDYIDADPATYAALRDIRELVAEGAVALAGNMECALLERCSRDDGGEELVSKAMLQFAKALPLYHRQGGYVFVHAGLRPGVPLERQLPRDLIGIREEFWMTPYAGEEPVVFGHTPTRRIGAAPGELWLGAGMIGIDTGAKHGLRLTLVELHGRMAYSCGTGHGNRYSDYRCVTW